MTNLIAIIRKNYKAIWVTIIIIGILYLAGYVFYLFYNQRRYDTITTNQKIIELFENATPMVTTEITTTSQTTEETKYIEKLTTPIPILVLASTDNQDYIDFINHYWIPLLTWLDSHRGPELNVYIYLIFGAGNSFDAVNIPEALKQYFLIFEDIPESYTPGILQKTVRGFEEMGVKHPDYTLLYRTNISTFLLLDRIVARMNKVIDENGHGKQNTVCTELVTQCNATGVSGIYWGCQLNSPPEYNKHKLDTNIRYVSGTDIMLSHDVVQFIIDNKGKLNYDIVDDLEIGHFLHDNKNIIGTNPVEHILWKCKPEDIHMNNYLAEVLNDIQTNNNFMIVRLRCPDSSNTRKPDTDVMKFLLSNYYS